MCTSPLWIKNKGYRQDDPLSPYMVQVPCGRCEECKEARIQEVLFRADWHNVFVSRCNGTTIFVTLTFNEKHLNYITYHDEGVICKCSTWNNSLLHKFVKRLSKCACCKVDYLVTAERGHDGTYIDDQGNKRTKTKRPHYHAILWFYNESALPVPDTDTLYRYIATCWSTFDGRSARYNKMRNQSIVDLTKNKSLPRYTYCRAKVDPIGHVYNEGVQRTAAQATKYVVKYAFKDAYDITFNLDPSSILSSKFPLSFADMRPKIYQSINLGNYFFESNCANMSPIEVGEFLASYNGETSDGETCIIPRYYIQKHCQDIVVLGESICYDDVETWNAYGYGHRPNRGRKKDGTLKDVFVCTPFGVATDHRITTETQRIPNEIGRVYSSAMHKSKCIKTYQALQSYLHHDFEFPTNTSLPPLGKQYYDRLQGILQDYGFTRSRVCRLLAPLSLEAFVRLYDLAYHCNNFDNLLLARNDSSIESQTMYALYDFLLLNLVYNHERKAITAKINKAKYEQNKTQQASRSPHVWNNPKNTDFEED